MFTLITGGSASGKSEYAEQLLQTSNPIPRTRYYIATMKPFGEEAHKRIEKHRKQREQRDFQTIEHYLDLSSLNIPDHADVLLECMSNLVVNEWFDEHGSHEGTLTSVIEGVQNIIKKADNLVIVTNEVFSDGVSYNQTTLDYIKCLGEVNQQLVKMVDQVVEVVYTIPIMRKNNVVIKEDKGKRNREDGQGLDFVIGGYSQGKCKYVAEQYGIEESKIINAEQCTIQELLQAEYLYGFHNLVRKWMKQKEDYQENTINFLQNGHCKVLISDEVGYGIVPIDALEREYREAIGRMSCLVGKESDNVIRVVCGIGQKIKGL